MTLKNKNRKRERQWRKAVKHFAPYRLLKELEPPISPVNPPLVFTRRQVANLVLLRQLPDEGWILADTHILRTDLAPFVEPVADAFFEFLHFELTRKLGTATDLE